MINFEENIKNNKILNLIKPHIHKKKVYVVGGYLRDLALGKTSCDIDLVTVDTDAKELGVLLSEKLDAHFVSLDEENRIYRVVLSDKVTYIDIAQCEGEDIYADLRRRDFTINALAYDIENNKILDVCDSLADIKNCRIKEICEKNISDDPLRILRAFRFRSELGFGIEKSLNSIILKHAPELEKCARERINTELVKLFAARNAAQTLLEMDNTGLLELLFAHVGELKKIPPNSHHHLGLFEHSVETVNKVTEFIESAPDEVKEHFESISLGGLSRKGYLKFAAFLHDIGKPKTWTIEPDTGRHRFIKHDDAGAKMVPEILKKLKFSNKQIKYIQKLIKYHIYPANVVTGENFTDKAVLRFFRKMEDEVLDVIAIAYGDRLSARGPEITEEIINNNINGLKNLMHRYLEMKNELAPLPKLLDGNEVMQILNIKPSARLGKILKALNEAQISSEVITKEEAVSFVKSFEKMF